MRAGITYEKIPCYMCGLSFRWIIAENPKIFQSYVKHFLFFLDGKNCRILIG